MFAIIETGGKQYQVAKGDTLEVEKLETEEGKSVKLDQVLLVSDNTGTTVGAPTVKGAYVEVKVVNHKRGDKIRVFKMKAKKRYQKTQGHRQSLTTIEITDIKLSGGAKKEAPAKKAEAKKEAPTKKVEVKKEA